MKKLLTLYMILTFGLPAFCQSLTFKKAKLSDTAEVERAMQSLAVNYLNYADSEGMKLPLSERYRFELLAGQFERAIESIRAFREMSHATHGHPPLIPYELFAKAKIRQQNLGENFKDSYKSVFRNYLVNCSDTKLSTITTSFTTYDAVVQFTAGFKTSYQRAPDAPIPVNEASELLKAYFLYHIFSLTEPIVFHETEQEENQRYLIHEELITSPRDGAELSVITVRKRSTVTSEPLPAILIFTIYADSSNKNQAMLAASKGYVGVIATSRGKRQSKNAIEPYKYEHRDVYVVIDWISHQAWNNGKVGMYGGSYNGFSQWASLKEKVHPALKTIVPSVSAAPGIDVPMENNIFFNFPYKWIPYVTNDKFLDNTANYDSQRWQNLQNTWFNSGAPYNKLDSIDGTPNRIFQEWINHPGYDSYWQSMIPYKEDFAHIDIPILSTTGYYDDGQRGAMYYYNEHLKYKPNAEHYLLIGPYDHWGAQGASSPNLRGYEIDPVAEINIRENLVFEWFDYILKGKEKPALLKDKVNFQVMGKNEWLHTPALGDMSTDSLVYYLQNAEDKGTYLLATRKTQEQPAINLSIDLADRSTSNNVEYYPWPIMQDSINQKDGLIFQTAPFENEVIFNGSFSGELKVTSNKKDFDFSVTLYELTPEGKYFHLSYYIGRASYAKSREKRELITPGVETTISFDNTRIISKKMAKGSRLVAVINGDKNEYAQINYGTGRDVSTESIVDAAEPLLLKFSTDSKISIPVYLIN